jgi:chromosome segregation protein
MHIVQIDIDNFKSFGSQTVIPFEPGFTTISGPNGSGKSNIIDSILFCLGLSSSRTLRAEKLSDLINNLSKRREAQVAITFQSPRPVVNTATEGENLELAALETDIVPSAMMLTVGRRIRETPSGFQSIYTLDGRTTTLTEIHERMAQFHVSPGCYNVMMQGDVAGIVHMSATERRKILDEMAGVAEFDRKIEQAQGELGVTGQHIEHNLIILSEIEQRLDQLAKERDVALQYQALKQKHQHADVQRVVCQYVGIGQAMAQAETSIAQTRQRQATEREALDALKQAAITLQEELDALQTQIRNQGEAAYLALRAKMEGLKTHVARKEEQIRHCQQQSAQHQQTLATLARETRRFEDNLDTVAAEMEGFKHQLTELEGLLAQERQAYDRLSQRFDQLTDATGAMSQERLRLRQQLETLEDAMATAHRRLADLDALRQRLAEDNAARQARKHHVAQQHEALATQQADVQAQLSEATQQRDHLEGQLRDRQHRVSDLRSAWQAAQAQARQLERQLVQMEAKKLAYEDVHHNRAVETILASGLPGIHGTVAQLMSVEADWAVAIETALGGRLHNIVVDNDATAQTGIELLQRQRAGRATFLPINQLQAARRLPPLPNREGVVGFALNLIQCDARYEEVFAWALGETLVMESMTQARSLLRQYRMVTRDGSLLERTGAMTGGSSGQKGGSSVLSKGNDKQLQALRQEAQAAENETLRLETAYQREEAELEALKTSYTQCLGELSQRQAQLDALNKQQSQFAAELGRGGVADVQQAHQTPEALAEETQSLAAQLAAWTPQAEALRGELAALDAQLPQDAIDTLRQEMTEARFQVDYYETQVRNLQTDIKAKTLETSHHQAGLENAHQRIAELEATLKDLAAQQAEAQADIAQTEAQVAEMEEESNRMSAELKRLHDQRDVLQRQWLGLEKDQAARERALQTLEEQVAAFRARQRELAPALETVAETLRAHGLTPSPHLQPEADDATLARTMQRLEKEMAALEPVNMRAIDDYETEQARKHELAEKNDTLEREKSTIHERIAQYQSLKLSAFQQTYETVDGHFKQIFSELADGEGQLTLTQPDAPFEGGLTIQAQPRGKKMQRLESMSGGEKSLTSLAFVFALQRTTPAPFYALDEVDMNLDGLNAEKLAAMVRRESQQAQFLVVSLRKPMLEHSDRTIGVTQRRDGVTKVTGIKRHASLPQANARQAEGTPS